MNTQRCRAYDRAAITQRVKDKDGYLHVPGLIAASDNVQPYLAGELGLKGTDPKRVVRVYRPKAEIDKSAPAWDGMPVTLGHPTRMVDAKLWRTVARGEATRTKATDEGLESELVVKDAAAIDAIEKDKTQELSCAYDFHLTMQSGVSPRGQAYDAVAADLIPNHIAIVRMGRSRTPDGKPCRVADSSKETHMRILVFDAMLLGAAAPTQLPEMDDNAAAAVDTIVRGLASARDAALEQRDAVLTECAAKLETQAKDHATALKALEDGIPARVEAEAMDRANVLAGAKALSLELKPEGKATVELRREVLTAAAKDAGRKTVMDAMVPDLAKATDEQLKLATAALFALPTKVAAKDSHGALGSALAGGRKVTAKDAKNDSDGDEACSGRASMMNASANAWKRGKGTK